MIRLINGSGEGVDLTESDIKLILLALSARSVKFYTRANEVARRDDLDDAHKKRRIEQNMELSREYKSLFDLIREWNQ